MKDERDGLLYCNFCGRYNDEAFLIAGPGGIHICDSCVDMCVPIVKKHRDQNAAPRASDDVSIPVKADDTNEPLGYRDALDKLDNRIDELRDGLNERLTHIERHLGLIR